MRETTRLLMEHFPRQLAELVESCILPGKGFNAGKSGHWELASQASVEKLNRVLNGAAYDNNKPMMEMLFARGADSYYTALAGAVRGDHVLLADEIINTDIRVRKMLMATLHPRSVPMLRMVLKHMDMKHNRGCIYHNAFNTGLQIGNANLVTYCLTYGDFNPDFDDGLFYACSGGDRGLILMMLHLGGDIDVNEGMRGACGTNNITLAKRMISLGANAWNSCLAECSELVYEHKFAAAELMITHGATDICTLSYNENGFERDELVSKWILAKMIRPCCRCGRLADAHNL